MGNLFTSLLGNIEKMKDDALIEGERVSNQSIGDYLKSAFETFANNMQQDPASMAMNFMPLGMQIKPVYHGSPYKFDKFSNKNIGTGEGAQAFGYGHYLTDSPEVASKYAEDLYKSKDSSFKLDVNEAKTYLKSVGYDDELLRSIPEYPMNFQQLHGELNSKGVDVGDTWTALEKASHKKDISDNLYTATINKGKPASEDVFLEWDKPFEKQPQQVIDAVRDMIEPHKLMKEKYNQDSFKWKDGVRGTGRGITNGSEIERELTAVLGSEKKAAEYLASKGITGIKYPSGTLSGIKGSKSYNYVVFDPENITINKRNGVSLLGDD